MKEARTIIRTQVVSEKAVSQTEKQNKYVFEVDSKANKIEICQAIEEIFKVKVLKVNTSHVGGKWKRVRAALGKTSSWKKATVTLKPGQKIEFA